MSYYEKGTFITVPNRPKIQGMKSHIQSVYIWLCFHSNQDGESFPSLQTISQESGVSRRGVVNAIRSLEQENLIKKTSRKAGKKNLTNVYKVVIGAYPSAHGAPPSAHGAPPPSAQSTQRTQSNIELNPLNSTRGVQFAQFWELYPRHVNKKRSETSWRRLTKTKQLAVLADLPRRRESSQWQKDNGAYIPHPTTYLNGERWNDDVSHSEKEDAGLIVIGAK